MNESQMATLRGIFREELGLQDEQLTDAVAYNSIEAWDSLRHLQIISRLEEAFGIEIEVDDIIAMENFGKAKAILEKYLH